MWHNAPAASGYLVLYVFVLVSEPEELKLAGRKVPRPLLALLLYAAFLSTARVHPRLLPPVLLCLLLAYILQVRHEQQEQNEDRHDPAVQPAYLLALGALLTVLGVVAYVGEEKWRLGRERFSYVDFAMGTELCPTPPTNPPPLVELWRHGRGLFE